MSSPPTPGPAAKAPSPPAVASPPAEQAPEPAAAPPAEEIIEADDDANSAYTVGTDVTDTTTLRSSILNHKWENGRRYHSYGDGTYWGPNDDRQQEAEDLMHEMLRIVMKGKLYEAPIGDNPQAVLDVGCGTGIWAIEFADLHPSAEVLGVDLSPIQPDFVPPNCKFEVDDMNKEWTYPENYYDLIHLRYLTGCVPDWVELLTKARQHLKPGGWVEHVELWGAAKADDGTMSASSPLRTWAEIFEKVGKMQGKPFFWEAAAAVRDAGFVNVVERRVKIPIGTWPKNKELKQWGVWNRQFLLDGLEGFSLRSLTELLGWERDKAELFLVDMRKELMDPKLHSYLPVTIIYGQKPEV